MAPAPPAFARLRERLRSGPPLVGTFLKLPATEAVDIVASAGFDLVVIDGEHSQLVEGDRLRLVRYAAAIGLPAVVRIPSVDAGAVNRLLEAGAAGIQLSSLRSMSEREALTAATRYAPGGRRSVSLAHPGADYGGEPLAAYLQRQAAGPILIGQIETATTADPLAELLPGLDVAFIGSTDLSVDMGRPGQLDDARVLGRVREIAEAASAAGVPLGAWAGSPDALGGLLAGHRPRYLVVASDLQMLRSGASAVMSATRKAFP